MTEAEINFSGAGSDLPSLTVAAQDAFGFLEYSEKIIFDGGHIIPSPDFSNACEWGRKYQNTDGWIYPPMEHMVKCDPMTGAAGGAIPNTERPSLLHQVPPSHLLYLHADEPSADSRKSHSGFLIHLLAYIFGTRLQFHDWWLDGRVPVKPTNNTHFTHAAIEGFISHSYTTWQAWDTKNRKLFANILYMHSRTPSYEWDWERFLCEYIVFDALFALSKTIFGFGANKHKDRFKVVCNYFGIPFNERLIDNIYTLRNELFHESLWGGGQPCTAENNAFMQSDNLRRFNARLIPAVLGYKTPFIQTDWECMGTGCFDEPATTTP